MNDQPDAQSRDGPLASQPTAAWLLATMFTQAPVAMALFDTDLRAIGVNPALAEALGRPADELAGRHLRELPGTFDPDPRPLLEEVLRTGVPATDVEVRRLGPGEENVAQHWIASFFRVEGPHGPLGAGAVALDVSERRAAEVDARLGAERLDLLARAGMVLGSSLDLHTIGRRLADIAVPAFADHCLVDLVDDDGTLRRRAGAHTPGAKAGGSVDTPTGQVPPYPRGHPVLRVLEGSTPVLVADAADDGRADDGTDAATRGAGTDAATRGVGTDAATGGATRGAPGSAGARSFMVVPLAARGRLLGAVTFITSSSGRRYGEADMVMAVELGGRASVAMDNARLYERQRTVALALQHSLLPHTLWRPEHLDVAHRYLPATTGAEVGGDWYDIVSLSAGRAGLVIGDVMGKGVRAAAIMGQLRAAVRAYAVMDLAPATLLSWLDGVVQGLEGVELVTCVYAVWDPGSGRLSFANAGHPPPVLRHPDGKVELLNEGRGVPLGVGGFGFSEASTTLEPGSTILLYTDGLIETRHRLVSAGIDALLDALAEEKPDLDDTLDYVVSTLGATAPQGDDTAILAVRTAPVPDDERPVHRQFEPDVAQAPEARRWTTATLQRWGLSSLSEVVALLVTELVTNSIRHAGTQVVVRMRRGTRSLFVEAIDGDPRLPQLKQARPHDEGGRGLHLVDAFSARWGARPAGPGKVVWFELALPLDAQREG